MIKLLKNLILVNLKVNALVEDRQPMYIIYRKTGKMIGLKLNLQSAHIF